MLGSQWLVTAGVLLSVCVMAVSTAELPQAAVNRIEAGVEAEMTQQQLVGVALGVVVDGEIVYLKGFGYADEKSETKVDVETMFRWASISKPVTAIAAMQLVDQGKLDLDADIRTYVPEFPDKGVKITARQLLCHQGGIVHYSNGKVIETQRDYAEEHPFESVILSLDKFKDSELINEPGTEFSYSTHGYMLLSAVLERAGGQPFNDQVRERILKPLAMGTMQPDYPWVDIPNRATGYYLGARGPRPSRDDAVHWKLGGGGYISTIEDLAKFAQGLMAGGLVNPETLDAMWTEQTTASGEGTGAGLGFFLQGEGVTRAVMHSGSQNKTRTLMVLRPEQNAAVVFMSNSEYAEQGPFINLVLEVLAEN